MEALLPVLVGFVIHEPYRNGPMSSAVPAQSAVDTSGSCLENRCRGKW